MEAIRILERIKGIDQEYDEEADVLYLSTGEPRAALGVDIGDGTAVSTPPLQHMLRPNRLSTATPPGLGFLTDLERPGLTWWPQSGYDVGVVGQQGLACFKAGTEPLDLAVLLQLTCLPLSATVESVYFLGDKRVRRRMVRVIEAAPGFAAGCAGAAATDEPCGKVTSQKEHMAVATRRSGALDLRSISCGCAAVE